jgi:hypothetical protein
MLRGDTELPTSAELDRYAAAGVPVFLAAYGQHGPMPSHVLANGTPAAELLRRLLR